MALVEQAVKALLEADTTLTAQVPAERIYGHRLPQGVTLPAIRMLRVPGSTTRTRSHSGPSNLARTRLQIEAWDTTVLGAKTIVDLVRKSLDGTRGTTAGVRIDDIMVTGDGDGSNDDRGVEFARCDVIVWHDES